ncbi:YqaJ viral recombinase family protein [Luteimonas sp BLCC-B24]|uniref:lambda-exonuclease family protein n=1 Tax=Luteimonas sp. BLCC-B24 TaxID=3025317 RepID=UPI00234DE557|nr:YqaJ viral recombinase family protein [Luteimonas sp. BLCC-B24]MDC7805564.1 YqaJ viral recombinase family protein [Luteimonas sp. BLCC-B24]
MKIVELTQGTPEWQAHRAQHLNASDAPAMLGISPYKSRSELVRETATGVSAEVDDATQRRFDDGHRYEALARPIAEQIIGEDLFPCVGTEGKYSASFDGLTLMADAAFEHKSLNDTLRAAMVEGCKGADLPEHYRVQMEHQCMVSGAESVLFMASKWNGDELVEERHCWYYADLELRERIVAGWTQFEADVAAYETPASAPHVAPGRAPDQLPALRVEVTGMVTASNLAEWKDAAIAVFRGISTDLQTDQDFADAEKTVKWCGDIEEQLKAAKARALSQTESIEELFRTIDQISAEAREKRLDLNKLVTRRKEERRSEIGNAARRAVLEHVRAINESLGECAIDPPATLVPDIAAAIKGKRSFAAMQEAVDAVAANAKIAASQQADRVRANAAILAQHAEHAHLFADRVSLCASKAPDDLRNLVAARVAEAQRAEAERLEQERERIRQEETARIEREQAEAAAAEAERVERARAQAAQQEPEGNAGAGAAPAPTAAATAASGTAPAAATGDVVAPRLGERIAASVSAPSTARIKLGDINARIAPLSIDAAGLASLGFQPVGVERAAKLYREADFPLICTTLAARLVQAGEGKLAA